MGMSRAWIPVAVLVLGLAFSTVGVQGMCSMIETCYNGGVDSPCHPVPDYRPPAPLDFGGAKLACPQYKDGGCCTADQNRALNFNFMLIGFTFGKDASNGCEACAENLRKFWCDITCGPNQADYLHPIEIANVTDPVNEDHRTTVLKNRVDLDTDFACNMYASCHDTGKAREFTVMKTCDSFLNYMGETQAIAHGTFLEFNYTHAPSAMKFPPLECQNYTIDGQNGNCPCSSCAAACSATGKQSPSVATDIRNLAVISPTHGADWTAIVILYSVIAGAASAVVAYRIRKKWKSAAGPTGTPTLTTVVS